MVKKIVILIILLVATYILLQVGDKGKKETQYEMQTYINSLHGFSFTYPSTYKLSIRDENTYFEVVLVDKDESEQLRSEGPTSINIHVYTDITLENWLKKNESNFNLATDSGSAIIFQGMRALQYSWDGLYRGKTIAFSRGGDVFALTGIYLDKGDARYVDFENIIDSFTLKDQVVQEELVLEYVKKNISMLSPEKEVLGGGILRDKLYRYW